MKHFAALALFLFLAAVVARGQVFPFRTYSIEKGLSEAVVNDLMQDQEGYLWVATGYGLNRFNGIEFENYYTEDGLLNNKIHALLEDNKQQIWVGTEGGVNIIKKDSIYTLPELEPLESTTILDIMQDHRGEYWFATDGKGVWHLDEENNLTQYQEVHGMGDNRVRKIIENKEGVLWFGTRGGLTKLEDGNFRTFTSENGLPDNRIRDLILVKDSLWIATRGGLCRFYENEFSCFTENDGLINNRIQTLSKDEHGNLWLGTEEGVSYFNNGTFTNYSVDDGLVNNIIHATLYDREGNIWFGSFGGGISLFLGDHFMNYTVEVGLPNNVVTSITQGKNAHWVTTYGGGIVKMQDGISKVLNTDDGLVDNKVYTVTIDEDGRLFIGTRWGLSIYRDNRFYNFDETELPFRKIRSILIPQYTQGVWLGTYGEGVLRYLDGRFIQLTEEEGLANNIVMAVEETPDGSVWFATYGGVSQWKNGTFTNYSIEDGLPNNGVLDILRDETGHLWFATFGGIGRFEDGVFTAITEEQGLPDKVCYFIEQDNNGIFWIGTNKGVIRFDYEAYTKGTAANAFKLITQDQGLVSNEMNAGASFKDDKGNLWFGSVGGLTKFNPNKVEPVTVGPKVHISNVSVSGEAIPFNPELEIGSDNHNVTFEFIGISLSAPEQVVYEYRLKNTGEGWQQTNRRRVRYSSLVPGDYTFEVKARNADGNWSKETARISFTVLAPFWLQWWFGGLMFLTFIGIIYFIYTFYQARKMIEIERMRVRIASDLHDDVGSALTEIALQSDFLQTMPLDDTVEHSLRQIGSQSRKIVSSLDDIVWSIDARNDTVGDLTDRMQDYVNNVLAQKEVVYHFEGNTNEKLEVSLKENLYLIFKEAINNIAKHSNARKVDITLSTKGGDFLMSVKDDGKMARNERKSGQGLRNMNMRAKRIDANVYFNNSNGFEVRVEKNS